MVSCIGQNKLAKDHHLRDLLLDPDPPNGILPALPFDSQTLRDAFTLEVGGLPDVSSAASSAYVHAYPALFYRSLIPPSGEQMVSLSRYPLIRTTVSLIMLCFLLRCTSTADENRRKVGRHDHRTEKSIDIIAFFSWRDDSRGKSASRMNPSIQVSSRVCRHLLHPLTKKGKWMRNSWCKSVPTSDISALPFVLLLCHSNNTHHLDTAIKWTVELID